MEENPKIVTLAADTSSGQQVDIELAAVNALWVAAGAGIEVADVWMKDVAGVTDLRVRIMRLGSALEVVIDRGERDEKWWPPDAAPRLLIVLDGLQRIASATASLGQAAQSATLGL